MEPWTDDGARLALALTNNSEVGNSHCAFLSGVSYQQIAPFSIRIEVMSFVTNHNCGDVIGDGSNWSVLNYNCVCADKGLANHLTTMGNSISFQQKFAHDLLRIGQNLVYK